MSEDYQRKLDYYKEMILELKNASPETFSLLRKIIKIQEKKDKWDILDVKVSPRRLQPLLNMGILERDKNFKYHLKDREIIEEALTEMGLQRRTRLGPGFNVTMDTFDNIVNYENVKKILIKALRARDPVHVLLVGPPGVGKSLLAQSVKQKLEELNECVGWVEGGKTLVTGAGLIEVVLQMPEDSPCLLIIDELDKMDKNDYSLLYSLMTTGEIIITKHKNFIHEKRRIWVLATANYLDRIPEQIQSRFFIIKFRRLTEEEYREMIPKILEKNVPGIDRELAEYIAKKLAPITRDPRNAIQVAKLSWTKEDVDFIVKEFMAKTRSYRF